MFARNQIDAMCSECHHEHDVPARKVIQRFQELRLATEKPQDVVCTSCHFEHRPAHRVVQWDKETGKVLVRETRSNTGQAPGKEPSPSPKSPAVGQSGSFRRTDCS